MRDAARPRADELVPLVAASGKLVGASRSLVLRMALEEGLRVLARIANRLDSREEKVGRGRIELPTQGFSVPPLISRGSAMRAARTPRRVASSSDHWG